MMQARNQRDEFFAMLKLVSTSRSGIPPFWPAMARNDQSPAPGCQRAALPRRAAPELPRPIPDGTDLPTRLSRRPVSPELLLRIIHGLERL